MSVSRALRFEILRRDRHACTYCGAKAPDVRLHIDHVIPESLGGSDDPANLVTACEDCNAGKAGRMIDEDTVTEVDIRAARWANALAQAAAERHAQADERQRRADEFLASWREWTPTPPVGEDYVTTINRFLDLGLQMRDLNELVDVAMSSPARDTWRYFCGCCNRRIDDLRQRALEILEADDA